MRFGKSTGDDDAWGWLDPLPAPSLRIVSDPDPDPAPDVDPGRGLDSEPEAGSGAEASAEPSREGRWLVALPQTRDGAHTPAPLARRECAARRVLGRAWAGVAATVTVMIGVVAVWGNDSHDTGDPVRATAAPAATTVAAEGACTGLSGTVVTDRPGDTATVAGVIATFEAAYYTQRSAQAAMRLLAPESGIAQEGLAAGIASIPAGTTHCVAVTLISATTANVHVVELHPDQQRVDYLQVINTRAGEGGALLISNVQGQG